MAELLLSRFQEADTNSDGLISRSESSALFPELTEAEFDDLDLNGDGFLTEAELRAVAPGCTCPSPGNAKDFAPLGLAIYLLAFFDKLLGLPGRIAAFFRGESDPEDENGN